MTESKGVPYESKGPEQRKGGEAGGAGGPLSTARTRAPAKLEVGLASSAPWASIAAGLDLS